MFGSNKQKISSLFQSAKNGDEFEVMLGNILVKFKKV